MSQSGDSDLLVLARRVLLDALDALSEHLDALILIGAQAIYIHTAANPLALPETTKDSDLAVDRRELADDPLLEQAMEQAGFKSGTQPGAWIGSMGIPVDLMMPDSMSDPGGKRGADIPPHSRTAVRRATGLEAAIVDHAWTQISALEEADTRTITIKVAGPAALLIAKMHKLGERNEQGPQRLVDKDAHDVYRLLASVPTGALADALRNLRTTPLAADTTEKGLQYFVDLFTAGPDALGCAMAGRAEDLLGDPELASQATAVLAQDLMAALGSP